MSRLSVVDLGIPRDLFWPVRCEVRTAKVEVAGTGKSCFVVVVFVEDIPENTILLLLDIILLYVLFGAIFYFTASLRIKPTQMRGEAR